LEIIRIGFGTGGFFANDDGHSSKGTEGVKVWLARSSCFF
jgi:hypothetical protein